MDFVAIDFETANADYGSVCQVGAVTFKDGVAVDGFTTLVDPGDHFAQTNVHIHGIDENAVRGAPAFRDIHAALSRLVQDRIVVSHTSFDQAVFEQVHVKHGLQPASCRWLDTAKVARRAWPQYAHAGYGLKNLAKKFGIDFEHHDAGEDAHASGRVLVRAILETGISVQDWLVEVEKPLTERATQPRVTRDGAVDGPFHGQVLVFTGTLSIPRMEAANIAAAAGCNVHGSVSERTNILVVGDRDAAGCAEDHTKSSKYRKAEKLISAGVSIRIIREADFIAMCYGRAVVAA